MFLLLLVDAVDVVVDDVVDVFFKFNGDVIDVVSLMFSIFIFDCLDPFLTFLYLLTFCGLCVFRLFECLFGRWALSLSLIHI